MPCSASANDRTVADLDRARLAGGSIEGASAELPLPAELLGLCDHRIVALWGRAGRLAGTQTDLPMPPVGRPGPRSRSMTRFPT